MIAHNWWHRSDQYLSNYIYLFPPHRTFIDKSWAGRILFKSSKWQDDWQTIRIEKMREERKTQILSFHPFQKSAANRNESADAWEHCARLTHKCDIRQELEISPEPHKLLFNPSRNVREESYSSPPLFSAELIRYVSGWRGYSIQNER